MADRSLLTVSQFANKHRAFREAGIRHLIFNAKSNGFDSAIRRVGRRILIDEDLFFNWLDTQTCKDKGDMR